MRDGDLISLNADTGSLELLLDEQVLASRERVKPNRAASHYGHGRELFVGCAAAPAIRNRGPVCSGITTTKLTHRAAILLVLYKTTSGLTMLFARNFFV